MKFIFAEFPDFQKYWKEYLVFWDGNSPNYGLEISEFYAYVRDLLQEDKRDNDLLIKIFNFVEQMMIEGEEDVQTAFATCFLENLINATSWNRISASSFVHLLGKESKEYCKGWDEFTGVKTEGLWDDNVH